LCIAAVGRDLFGGCHKFSSPELCAAWKGDGGLESPTPQKSCGLTMELLGGGVPGSGG